MGYYVYILQSRVTKKYYTGSTENMEHRILQHNSGKNKSTKQGIPWEIVHIEQFQTRSEAMLKESKIKNRGAKRYLEVK